MTAAASAERPDPGGRSSSAIPKIVWEAAPLRGLDDRARGDLSLAASRRTIEGGSFLFRAGDPADHLYVVERGGFQVVDRTGKTLRRAGPGDALGEEALVLSFGARVASARCDEGSAVVALPAALLRRVWQRAGTAGHVAKLTRAMTRTAMRDSLAASPLGLDAHALELLLDGARLLEMARGDVILRPRETRRGVYVILEGLVRLESESGQARAHLRSGDVLFGADVARASAAGPVWLTFVDERTLRAGNVEGHAHGIAATCEREAVAAHGAAGSPGALQDLGRFETARSLLVFDGDACVRCGYCSSSCADAHPDGLSRLWRHGPIVSLQGFPSAILPSSCEHCRSPACLPACPTGAIARSESGAITLRANLCTGCGSCAKACPWENLAIAARPGGSGAEPGTSADVAVKCDLCASVAEGPACVRACPTAAVVRIDGTSALREVPTALRQAAATEPLSPRAKLPPAYPAAAVAAAVAMAALGGIGPKTRVALGVLAAMGAIALTTYGALKRNAAVRKRLTRHLSMASHYLVHLAVGAVTFGAMVGHTRGTARGSTVADAALFAFMAASLSGGLAAAFFRLVPQRLSKLVRSEWLPEDTGDRARALADRVAAELSGKSDLVKAVFGRILDPYRRSPFTRVRLLVRSPGVDAESRALRDRVERALEGRGADKLEGLDRLVDAVVEHTSFSAARIAVFLLRAWAPLHVAGAIAALLLVLLHAGAEVWLR